MIDIEEDSIELLEQIELLSPVYGKLVVEYDNLFDNDPTTAFGVMKRASSLMASYEGLAARANKVLVAQEKNAKFTHARKSCELSNKPTEGERKAAAEESVLLAWEEYTTAISLLKMLEGIVRHLGRIYFDSKSVYEIGNRNLSKGFKYE